MESRTSLLALCAVLVVLSFGFDLDEDEALAEFTEPVGLDDIDEEGFLCAEGGSLDSLSRFYITMIFFVSRTTLDCSNHKSHFLKSRF